MVEGRIFVVGCSRSGTTLLQVLLASHPDVRSFPETNFFLTASGGRRQILARMGLPTGLEPNAIQHTLDLLNTRPKNSQTPNFFFSFQSAVRRYIDILDSIAMKEGKSKWVEKTPLHFRRIEFIERFVDEPQFVHIIRDGRDVVASIRDRAETYPDRFGWQKGLSYGIELWNEAIEKSKSYLGYPRHVFTTYERITADTKFEIQRICNELEIEFSPLMVEGDPKTQNKVIPNSKPWIHNAKKEPGTDRERKYNQVFDEEEKKEIESRIKINKFKEIKEKIKS
jgi:hypothetical protein